MVPSVVEAEDESPAIYSSDPSVRAPEKYPVPVTSNFALVGEVFPIPTLPVPRLNQACWLVSPGSRITAEEVAFPPSKRSLVIFNGAIAPSASWKKLLLGNVPGSIQERVPDPSVVKIYPFDGVAPDQSYACPPKVVVPSIVIFPFVERLPPVSMVNPVDPYPPAKLLVAVPAKFKVVTVLAKKLNVVEDEVISPPLTARSAERVASCKTPNVPLISSL